MTVAEYRSNNQDKIKILRDKYYEENRNTVLERNTKYREENLDKIKIRQKEYYQENIEEKKLQQKEYRRKNRKKLTEYTRNRYATNHNNYKLYRVCRDMVRRAYLAINTTKDEKTRKFLGYSARDLKQHIEKQFKEGMTWDNYGDWHIDHIIPISRAETYEEAKVLSQLSNLQPLWAEENLKKGSKLI